MLRLLLIRHGEVENPDGVLYGRLPGFGLSARGRAQIAMVAAALAAEPVTALYCSPLRRARESAALLGATWGLEPVLDERLTETDMGAYQGRRMSELWTSPHVRAPGTDPEVEPFPAIRARMGAFFADLRRRHPGATAAAVGHRDPLVLGLLAAVGRGEEELYRFRFETGEAMLLEWPADVPTLRVLVRRAEG